MEVIHLEDFASSAADPSARSTPTPPPKPVLPTPTPPTKKRKLSAPPPSLVHKSMTLAALREEADARGLSAQAVPRLKADTLSWLGPGSQRIAMSAEWGAVLALREKVRGEASAVSEKAAVEREARERAAQIRQIEKGLREEAEMEKMREREIEGQKVLHVFDCKAAHECKLAKADGMVNKGRRRVGTCDICRGQAGSGYACEACNFDVCGKCFELNNMTPEERRVEDARVQAALNERVEREREEARLYEEKLAEEEAIENARFDIEQFSQAVRELDGDAKDMKKAPGASFTVWKSAGYGNDGWHSYNPPPEKEFDS